MLAGRPQDLEDVTAVLRAQGDRLHQLGDPAIAQRHRDVDVGAQAGGPIQDRRLGAEEVPAGADLGEGPGEVGQDLSEGRAGRGHGRRDRWRP